MKVYLVMEGFEYEGETVMKVFARKEDAEEFRAAAEAEDVNKYYTYTIQEGEVIE